MLDSIGASLESCGERHWAKWLRSDAAKLRNGNLSGISHFLSAFGGMSSLNDLYISPANGHRIAATEASAFNRRISSDLSAAYSLATALQSEHASDKPRNA
jgi:hypothetical protein